MTTDEANGFRAFQVVWLDYTSPIFYKAKNKNLKKAYILLIPLSLTTAVHLELVQSQRLGKFMICFKRFVACHGRPQDVYSENGKTLKAAGKKLSSYQKGFKIT